MSAFACGRPRLVSSVKVAPSRWTSARAINSSRAYAPALQHQWQRACLAAHSRHKSTAVKPSQKPAARPIPEYLNIYRAGSTPTLFVGFGRVISMGMFLYGTALLAPTMYFNPALPNWWVPLTVVASAIPMVFTAVASAPMLHDIKIKLPAQARKSRADLQRFVLDDIPPETLLRVSYMKWTPWPHSEKLVFGNLRRVNDSGIWSGITNLEYHHHAALPQAKEKGARGNSGAAAVATAPVGVVRFYVNRDQKKDQSASPGIWDRMWTQIPLLNKSSAPQPPAPAPKPRSRERHHAASREAHKRVNLK